MLTMRMCPVGNKHRRKYRIVLANKKFAVGKQYIENLGHYDPISKEVVIKEDRVKYWLDQNIECSDRVRSVLIKKEIIAKVEIK